MNSAKVAAVTSTKGLVSIRCSTAFATGAVTVRPSHVRSPRDHLSRRLLRQAEHALADDVALDLAGATPDRLAATEEERAEHRADRIARPALVANGARPRPDRWPGIDEHRGRAEDVEGQLHGLFVHLAPEHLVGRAERDDTRVLRAGQRRRQGAEAVDPQDLDLGVVPHQALPDVGILERAVGRGLLDEQAVLLVE